LIVDFLPSHNPAMNAGNTEFAERLSFLMEDMAEVVAEARALRGASAQLRKESRRVINESQNTLSRIRRDRSPSGLKSHPDRVS
jgi:hypothetical protein